MKMAEPSFTFKKAAVEEEPGLPIFNLLETKTSSSSAYREQGIKDRKRPAGTSKDSKKKNADRENCEPSNRGPSKKPKTSESDADKRMNLKDLPIAKRVKEIGSGKVVSGMVKNIRNVSQPVKEMVDSTLLFKRGDAAGLYARLTDQGYLLLRDVLPRAKVLEGYKRILQHLQKLKVVDGEGHFSKGSQKGYTIQASTGEVLAGPTPKDKVEEYTEGWRDVCLDMAVQQVMNSDELLGVVSSLCRGKAQSMSLAKDSYSPLTLNPYFTWMRLKGAKEATMEHADYFYWKRQTDLFISVGDDTMYAVAGEDEPHQDHHDIPCAKCGSTEDEGDNVILLCDECDYGIHLRCKSPPLKSLPKGSFFCPNCTPQHEMGSVWIPFHDMTPEQSTLCVLPGSHRLPHYDKTLAKDGEVPKSFYGDEGKTLPWHVCPTLHAGDLVLFDLRLVQACTRNTDNAFRISADTRWYLKPKRDNWGLTPSTRFVKAAAENRLVWKNEVVKEHGGGGEEDEEEEDEEEGSEESDGGEEEEED